MVLRRTGELPSHFRWGQELPLLPAMQHQFCRQGVLPGGFSGMARMLH
jgi:hypothetical protein